MSVARCQDEVSSSEFTDWQSFLEQEWNEHEVMHYYMAQLTAEVVRSNAAKGRARRVKTEDYLIKFKTRKKSRYPSTMTPEQRLNLSKAAWCWAAGVKVE